MWGWRACSHWVNRFKEAVTVKGVHFEIEQALEVQPLLRAVTAARLIGRAGRQMG